MTTERKTNLPPIVDADTRLLVLGSLPGEASLGAARYYAHPRNRFWDLLGLVLQRDLAGLDYAARLAVLREHGIGLWDTVAAARRRGSLDAALRDIERAPLRSFVAALPNLRAVAFNGATAARLGRKSLGDTALALVDLPSSSPANAAMPFAAKAESWGRLRKFL